LAEHYLQAQVWDKAVTYLVQAAEEAQARYAYGVALERYTQALTLLKQHAPFTGSRNVELRFDVLCKQYYLLWDRGECQQAEASLRSLQQTVQGLDDPQRQAEALNQHLDFLYRASRFDEVVAVADEALALAQAHGLTRQMARTLKTKGEACSKCDREEGEQVLHHALDLWRKVGSVNSGEAVRMRAEILMSLVFYYVQRGLHTPAERAGQRLAALAQESESPMVAVSAFYSQAQLAEARGDYEAGLHYKQDCLELIRRVGLRRWEQAILTSLGNALAVRRAYGPAFAHYRRALELARQSADDYGIVTTRYNLGFLLSITGRHADAEAHLSASLELAGERELSSWKALALSGLGILYLQESQPGRRERARAEHYLQEALEILSAQQLEYGAPGVHYGLGLLSLSRQSVERAATHFEKGLEIAERSGDPVAAICCSYLALCHHLQNRREEALQLSARAVKLVESAASASYPQVVYRHRGRILDAQGQKVAARELLEKAYASIQAQKETLPDPDWQRAFLENVPANREIVAIYEVIQAQVQAGRI
jgi:tetratricopeptide (TPR) repeat protein